MCSYVSEQGQQQLGTRRMMVSLLLHGYATTAVFHRSNCGACCERDDSVMILSRSIRPGSERSAADFRKRNLKALGELFLQVLNYASRRLVKNDHRRIRWHEDQSRCVEHKAMGSERMKKHAAEIENRSLACWRTTPRRRMSKRTRFSAKTAW